MMSENYIMLNGKRVDLTDEQLEKLGLKVEKKDCFKRAKFLDHYYSMDMIGRIIYAREDNTETDKTRHKIANYCTNKEFMEQRALHETLSRLLWRFGMQNNGDKINWGNCNQKKYYVYFDSVDKKLKVGSSVWVRESATYFHTLEIAEKAINEIINPFVKEHPDFVW